MSNVRGLYAGAVVIEDEGGTGMVPARALRQMIRHALERGAGAASNRGRSWSLVDLIEADDAVTRGDLMELPPCVDCIDSPATTTNLHDRPVCSQHASRDDKDD